MTGHFCLTALEMIPDHHHTYKEGAEPIPAEPAVCVRNAVFSNGEKKQEPAYGLLVIKTTGNRPVPKFL
jgi:hypothetical protein